MDYCGVEKKAEIISQPNVSNTDLLTESRLNNIAFNCDRIWDFNEDVLGNGVAFDLAAADAIKDLRERFVVDGFLVPDNYDENMRSQLKAMLDELTKNQAHIEQIKSGSKQYKDMSIKSCVDQATKMFVS